MRNQNGRGKNSQTSDSASVSIGSREFLSHSQANFLFEHSRVGVMVINSQLTSIPRGSNLARGHGLQHGCHACQSVFDRRAPPYPTRCFVCPRLLQGRQSSPNLTGYCLLLFERQRAIHTTSCSQVQQVDARRRTLPVCNQRHVVANGMRTKMIP